MTKILSDDVIPNLKNMVTQDTPTIQSMMNYAGANRLAFGLGGLCVNVSHTDLNELEGKTGFYMGSDLTNAPEPPNSSGAGWWYIEQMIHNSQFRTQIVRKLVDAGECYQRNLEAGVWSPWIYMGNSLKPGMDRIVGWYDKGQSLAIQLKNFTGIISSTTGPTSVTKILLEEAGIGGVLDVQGAINMNEAGIFPYPAVNYWLSSTQKVSTAFQVYFAPAPKAIMARLDCSTAISLYYELYIKYIKKV